MTVQRQYILPNCTLLVEGLAGADGSDPAAPLTVVLHAECQFPGIVMPLKGGREFLDGLVQAVSDYAQSILSGVPNLLASREAGSIVTLEPNGPNRHSVTVRPTTDEDKGEPQTAVLTTVQFFDLMEAIDQLLADTQTLPELSLPLQPIPRRNVKPPESVAQRAAPVAVGASTLVAAAAALFFIPIPDLEPTRAPQGNNSQGQEQVELDGESVPGTTAQPGEPLESAAIADPTDPIAAAAALSQLEVAAPTITDEDTLAALQSDLVDRVESELDSDATFDDRLIYRVAVSETGEILGYKYENDPALTQVEATPLPSLMYLPVDGDRPLDEPVAQFRLTFEPDGSVTAERVDDDAP